ncbi:putative ribonuclease H-like domain-containing protein [Tanacetum coccineum]
MYNFDLKNVVPSGGLTCLFAKAIIDESNLWHRRIGHINFKTMNKLVSGNLVSGLRSKLFENDHTCVACQKGKQHKASCKTKLVSSISQPLQMLHMDLFRPTFVRSINHKIYCLVVTDDFSRFSWVFFLATKDETSGILKTFINGIENQINHKVKIIRCDNGTEFKNNDMNQFCGMKGIKREFSVVRTPQQNGVAERKNRTLIEAARTMLANSLLPTTFWAEVVNTACYDTIHCKALQGIHNRRTRLVEENLHVKFSEETPNIAGNGPNWLFDIDALTISMNYKPVVAGNQTNEVGAEADMNNLATNVPVSPILATRVHKDHPLEQIIRDIHSAPQTRRMTKNVTEHEAIQDELLQFKLQKVWTLVDLPKGKRAIGTKWVYRNKKDERGIVIDVPDKVYKVEKALYGLHQAHRATEENAEFHQIVDFLTTSSIHYALTVSPTIYASYIEQFWNTANSQKVNDVKKIHAIVDGKTLVISESSVRSDLHFNDEDEPFNDTYETPKHTKKVFTNMKRKGKDFSGRITPLFPSMLAPPVVEGEGSGQPSEPQPPSSTTQPIIEEQIPITELSSPQNTQSPSQALQKDTQLPQTSVSISNVADKVVFKERDDKVVRAITTAASLDASQASGNITKTKSTAMSNDPLSQEIGSGDRPMCQEAMGVPLLRLEAMSSPNNLHFLVFEDAFILPISGLYSGFSKLGTAYLDKTDSSSSLLNCRLLPPKEYEVVHPHPTSASTSSFEEEKALVRTSLDVHEEKLRKIFESSKMNFS